jgi:hypothetical protein
MDLSLCTTESEHDAGRQGRTNLASYASGGPNGSSKAIDDAARPALDLRSGGSLSDAELARVRTKLLEFIIILRGWDQKAKNTSAGLGNVDSICQQGP